MEERTPTEPATAARERPERVGFALALTVLAGLALRGVEAATKSLWLDEFHTLDVAAYPLREINGILAADVHTPAFFLATGAFHDLLSPHALRWIAIVPSMLAMLPLYGIARAAGLSALARVVVLGLYAMLPFQVQWGAELRPYAWLELAAITAVWAAFTPAATARGRTVRALVLGAAVAFGLYTHFVMALLVVGVGAVRLVVTRKGWPERLEVIGGGILGVALFVPWVLHTHPHFLRKPGGAWHETQGPGMEAPGQTRAAEADLGQKLAQIPVQLMVPRMGGLGGAWGVAATAGLAGLLLALVVMAALAVARRRAPEPGLRVDWRLPGAELGGPVLVAVLTSVALAYACVKFRNRLPLQYFAITAWAWPLVFGALFDCVPSRWRTWASTSLLGACALAGLAQASGAPREDLLGAVELAVERAEAEDAWLTAILWQPANYAHTTVFRYYAPDAAAIEPEDVPRVRDEGGRRPVVVLTRGAPDQGATLWALWGPLREGRKRLEAIHFDDAVSVYVYGPR